jgi:esterase/lipase
MVEIYRTIFKKQIISEFAKPKKKTNKVIILCGGMPGSPSKQDRIESLCEKGFWVFSPRYKGAWESHGEFLKKSPHLDILDVIDGICSRFTELWSGKKYFIKNPKIYLIGTSFGGPAAILNSKDKRVKKVIAICPVIDWRVRSKAEPMDKFGKFVKIAFGMGYRFSLKNWDKLARGKFYNPIDEINKIDASKIWLFHAEDDKVVNYKSSEKFAKLTGCKFTLLNKGGHSIGKEILTKKRYLDRIFKFFKGS